MIENILKYFGYIKEPKTEMELASLYIESLGDLFAYKVNKKEEEALFQKLSEVEGLTDYLRMTMVSDLQKYFKAPTKEQQIQINGAFSRTLYLRGRIVKANEEQGKDIGGERRIG